MVDLHDDSKGKSALISGSEARAWRQLTQTKGLIDAYLCCAEKSGGLFTRQAFCGQRLDRARLDRFYISEGILEKIKMAWQSHPQDVRDPQRKWEQGWIRVREVLRMEKRKMIHEQREIHDLKMEVLSLRKMTEDNNQTELLDLLRTAESKLRRFEQLEARMWRLRSRDKWLREGEALSRYFYAQTKAKFSRESIQTLRRENKTNTTDRAEILIQVQRYYEDLYRHEEPFRRFYRRGEMRWGNCPKESHRCRMKGRNILNTLPYYTMMTVGLSKQGIQQLRKSTLEFLWGANPNGTKKKPLLAWDWFERKKKPGGLGWPPLTEMANAFLLKNISKILQGAKED
ncbi:hypothetical protein R1sor_012494 [Riccia sorocarpa]|uniref:Uncharacterized protein n=1 Tax=Riccia sorocarpa TaxID=122646 RepID=A0ABD3I3X9_9MARC